VIKHKIYFIYVLHHNKWGEMRILISPKNLEEAIEAQEGGADIIDVKNPAEGSLGANFPWIISEVKEAVVKGSTELSATIGDFDYKPGTASLAALGAAVAGADYVKVGLYGIRSYEEGLNLLEGVVKAVKDYDSRKKVVGACYSDYARISSLHPFKLPQIGKEAGVDVVMVDTGIKDGKSTFEFMSQDQIKIFINLARENGLEVAIAGAISWEHLPILKELQPDIVGVRSIVCEKGRDSKIRREKVARLIKELRQG